MFSIWLAELLFFFFPPKFCLDEFSVTTKRIVLKFGDMIDIDMKLCKRVSKFKMADPKVHPGHAQTCLNFVWTSSLYHWMDCSKIWGFIRYRYEVLQKGFKGSPRVTCGHAPAPLLYKRPNQKPFRSPPLNHIYCCSL